MIEPLTYVVVALACLLLVASVYYAWQGPADRRPAAGVSPGWSRSGCSCCSCSDSPASTTSTDSTEKATFAAYLVSLPLIPIGTSLLTIKEKSRWAMGSMAVGAFAVAVMAAAAAADLEHLWLRATRGPSVAPAWCSSSLYGCSPSRPPVGRCCRSRATTTGRPLAYTLSALAAAVYILATWCLARGGKWVRVGKWACTVELVGVLVVGTASYLVPDAFPDKTVWSHFGQGYGFVPLVLPVLGLLWFRKVERDATAAEDAASAGRRGLTVGHASHESGAQVVARAAT